MKTPSIQTCSKWIHTIRKNVVLVFIVLLASSIDTSFGQNNNNNGNGLWQAIGPDTVFTNRIVKINNPIEVRGKVTADSMHVHGTLQIGDSSFYFDDNVGSWPNTHDRIRSSQGKISFMQGRTIVSVFT